MHYLPLLPVLDTFYFQFTIPHNILSSPQYTEFAQFSFLVISSSSPVPTPFQMRSQYEMSRPQEAEVHGFSQPHTHTMSLPSAVPGMTAKIAPVSALHKLQPPLLPRLRPIALPRLDNDRPVPASTQLAPTYPICLLTANLDSRSLSFLEQIIIPSPTKIYVCSPSRAILMEFELPTGTHTGLSVVKHLRLPLDFHAYQSMTASTQERVKKTFLSHGSPPDWEEFICGNRIPEGPMMVDRLSGHTDFWGLYTEIVPVYPGQHPYPAWILDVDVPSPHH